MTTRQHTALRLLLVNLLVVLGTANWIIFKKEDHRANGRLVLLEVTKYDPRSLMQGDYMALTYPIAAAIRSSLATTDRGEGLAVVAIDRNDVGSFRRIHDGSTLATDEHLLQYRIREGSNSRVRVAATEFFFQEGLAEEFERARYAELRVDESGRTLLVALRDTQRKRIGAPER
jgi:uncharacterized membrane-anchored protein